MRDEVDAVVERTRWLREQAPSKPAHLGEFGLANEKWQPTQEMGQGRQVWLWVFNPAASWAHIVIEQHPPSEVQTATLELSRLPAGITGRSGCVA